MEPSEYRKVIDVLAKTLGAGNSVELNYAHDTNHKIDVIDVTLNTSSDGNVQSRFYLRPAYLEISFRKEAFTQAKFAKLVSRFEYDLEQTFFRNIHLESMEEGAEYKIRINS